jgi:hypothetical protein
MIENTRTFLNWFYRERSGLTFPKLVGIRRCMLEVPLLLLGILVWYALLQAIPEPARRSFLSIFESLWIDASLLGVLLYAIVISYLRYRLSVHGQGPKFLLPNRVLEEYRRQFGEDAAVKLLAGIQLVTLGLFLIGVLLRARN